MNRQSKILFFILPIFALLILGILFFSSTGRFGSYYKVQEIIYRSKEDSTIRIEIQMQDVGAFGYNERTVKISPGYLFDSTQEIDIKKIDTSDWIKVNEYINELNIKGG